MHRDLLVNYEKVVKFLNFICDSKIKLRGKFSGICQVNPYYGTYSNLNHGLKDGQIIDQGLLMCFTQI